MLNNAHNILYPNRRMQTLCVLLFVMREVRIIPSKQLPRLLRVAAYCRVSSKKEEQLNSLEAQIQHFTDKIRSNPAWEFAGIFKDSASGRSVVDRTGFIDLMALCEIGRVDLILTKSVSRLGRNIVDTLEAVRQLTLWSTDIYFETEDFYASQGEKKSLFELLSGFAQAESEAHSGNIRWGLERALKRGTSQLYRRPCFGYRRNSGGTLEIIQEEADVVRSIFDLYLAGHSVLSIVGELEQQQIQSPSGNPKWSKRTIENVLANEKYIGNVLIGKTFNKDFLHPKRHPNKGEAAAFLMEDAHEPIIPKETFDAAQDERSRRSNVEIDENGNPKRKGTRHSTKRD